MSWDVSIMKFAEPYESIDDIPDDATALPLGTRSQVHDAVTEVFADADWSDPEWGNWSSDIGSVEFNLGEEDPADSMILHVRSSNEVVPMIQALCDKSGWVAIDCSTGEFLESAEGLEGWRNYRDQVLGNDEEQ